MTFPPFLRQTIIITAFSTNKAPSTLQITVYQPFSVNSDHFMVPFRTIQSHLLGLSESKSMSISIHG